jgi:hypothetical protein
MTKRSPTPWKKDPKAQYILRDATGELVANFGVKTSNDLNADTEGEARANIEYILSLQALEAENARLRAAMEDALKQLDEIAECDPELGTAADAERIRRSIAPANGPKGESK